jgi:FAD/FMN-containing dehydrogenase
MKTAAFTEDAWREFESSFDGALIRPSDADYDEARLVWNGMIERSPALIARAANTQDVVSAVNFARDNNMLLSVRGGGHNVAGLSVNDDGLVIDLSGLKDVKVDPVSRIVRAGGGVLIGELDEATQRFGLAVPMGVVSATGIAGLTLGGGYGWLRNMYGLSADNLIGAEVVTADGRILLASKDDHFDLLWGLRGGGGNFGIVTEFIYQAHCVGPDVVFTFVLHDGRGDRMKEGIKLYRDYSATAPDEVSSLLVTGVIPPVEEHFPKEIHNVPYVAYLGMYAGSPAEGQKAFGPLLNFGQPLLDFSGVMPYLDAQKVLDADYPDGLRYYWKSMNLMTLDDDVIDRIVKHSRQMPSPFSTVDLWHIGGAMARGSADESAFNGRHVAFLLSPESNWEDSADDEANIAWLRDFLADMEEFSDGSRYLNFPGFLEGGDEFIRKAFGSQYDKLATLKRKYDPDNLFRLNQNIKPE